MNLCDPIVPGVSAAGVHLGDSIEPVLTAEPPVAVHRFREMEKYVFAAASIWTKAGRVDQIGVRQPYSGKLPSGVGIGSTIADVERTVGPVTEDDEDNLVVPGSSGWRFETEEWLHGHAVSDNSAARITEIFVFNRA